MVSARSTMPTPVPAAELPDRGRGPAGGIHDGATGLFNEHYFAVAVDSRVAAARRHLRPVAIIQLSVARPGETEAMADPVAVSSAVRATLRDSDTACRMDDGRFAIILEDTPEEGAILTAERLRRAMGTAAPDHIQRAGVACYPAHAFNAPELLAKAERALEMARDWPQHRIEVAIAD
jgi:GGDEF domain-containing protein